MCPAVATHEWRAWLATDLRAGGSPSSGGYYQAKFREVPGTQVRKAFGVSCWGASSSRSHMVTETWNPGDNLVFFSPP